MHADNFLVHNRAAREAVEAVCEGLPQLDAESVWGGGGGMWCGVSVNGSVWWVRECYLCMK